VLTYAVPRDQLLPLIPPCLSPDTFQDHWGFVAAAFVQTSALRPKGFPAFLGNDFFLAGFRVFVQYVNRRGKRLRGLYILRSETDKATMTFLGNIFTHYRYQTTDMNTVYQEDHECIVSEKSDFSICTASRGEQVDLPAGSPFSTWKEARRFAGPLPFTFSFDREKSEVLIIEGVRSDWNPKPVEVISHHIHFLDQLGLKGIRLASAFEVTNIPYYWKKGEIESWNP
jgi:uncharacterized protein YqjF (DUF2071 family)